VLVKYRVPSLRDEDIGALTDVLLQEGASERTSHRATTAWRQFGILPSNRARSLAAISESASRLGDAVASAFKIVVSCLPSAAIESSSDPRALAVQEFSMAASEDELTFLRAARAVSVLVKGVMDFKPGTSSQAAEGVVQNEEMSEEGGMDYEIIRGCIFGKAIYDAQLLHAYFTRAFYKHILGVRPTIIILKHKIRATTSLCARCFKTTSLMFFTRRSARRTRSLVKSGR
jgi:hypothetical protein